MMKRKHQSGYYTFNQIDSSIAPKRTSIKYHKELIESGLVIPTKNGFRLINIRSAMQTMLGYSMWCIQSRVNTLDELTLLIIDAVNLLLMLLINS